MKKHFAKTVFLLCLSAWITLTSIRLPEPPEAAISNGLVRIRLYLPDAGKGYYRGTRFDWSGVIPSLEFGGHSYHGQWFDTYEPTTHDAIMGPVEEFAPLGYTEAKTGETFVKVGIGSLIKPGDQPYSSFKTYAISDPGKWKIRKKSNQVEFTHSLSGNNYAYDYKKTVMLIKGKPEMVLVHTLKNTGKVAIETSVYDHNFFVLDKQQTGPGYVVTLPIKNLSAEGGRGLGDLIKLEENQILFVRDLLKKESVYFPNLAGGAEMPYEIKVENIKTGAGVKIRGDRPVTKMVFWSSSTTVSPEPYINIKVQPGEEFSWKIAYEYYPVPGMK